jgi:hypothetical protein
MILSVLMRRRRRKRRRREFFLNFDLGIVILLNVDKHQLSLGICSFRNKNFQNNIFALACSWNYIKIRFRKSEGLEDLFIDRRVILKLRLNE